ncbi:SLC13 family permease [bacterium]|nr:SLC13 family permease [bacterium]
MFSLIYTSVVLLCLIILLVNEAVKPALAVFLALLLLLFGGIITVDEAFQGFSNQGMITVAFLFVVSAALQTSGLYEKKVMQILGHAEMRPVTRYFRLLFPVAGLSAFLNNTPIVASLIPLIKNWSKKTGMSSSRFLLPISYAAILGGTCTLIGTSTNLIVHGMLLERNMPGLGFFEITQIGLPVTLAGLLFLALYGYRLLPERKELSVQLGEQTREFVIAIKIGPAFEHLGQTVKEAGLRHLQGLFLFQIIRNGEIIAPVSHDERLFQDDRLFFTGLPETIYELQRMPGLHVIKDTEYDLKNIDSDSLGTYEAVVSNHSPLIGHTVRESNFRKRYNAVILAIHRSGSRVKQKVGDIVFEPNDTLFLIAKKGFDQVWYHQTDFALVSSSVDIYQKPRWKGNLALFLLFVMILSAAMKWLPIILAAAATAVLMVIIGIISPGDARKSVNVDVLLLIASSFGIAKALYNSGLAYWLAQKLTLGMHAFGSLGVLVGLYILTSLLTWIITNNAVAAIMFPIALAITKVSALDVRAVMLTLAMGASSSFVTPISYQTNLMVYSQGGYRFRDFMKIGIPLNLIVGCVTLLSIRLLYF